MVGKRPSMKEVSEGINGRFRPGAVIITKVYPASLGVVLHGNKLQESLLHTRCG